MSEFKFYINLNRLLSLEFPHNNFEAVSHIICHYKLEPMCLLSAGAMGFCA